MILYTRDHFRRSLNDCCRSYLGADKLNHTIINKQEVSKTGGKILTGPHVLWLGLVTSLKRTLNVGFEVMITDITYII